MDTTPPDTTHADPDAADYVYVGSDGTGGPHCDACRRYGHDLAHPDLGCADVGCASAHPDVELDDPAPTPAERAQDILNRARTAQDRLGWADPDNHMEVTHVTVDLARVVTDLARELRALVAAGGAQ